MEAKIGDTVKFISQGVNWQGLVFNIQNIKESKYLLIAVLGCDNIFRIRQDRAVVL